MALIILIAILCGLYKVRVLLKGQPVDDGGLDNWYRQK